jgi:hypothetical protein
MTESVSSAPHWLIVSLEGVVTTSVPEARIEALAEAAGLAPSEAHQRLWASGFVARCCLGQLSLDEMIAGIRERLAVDLTEAHLMGLWSLAYEPDLGAIADLAAATGFRIGTIADETPLFRAAFEPYLPEVELLADCSWFSHEHHALTDDVRFYQSISDGPEISGATPTFVTTRAARGEAAAAAGWQVVPDLQTALRGNRD